jgi:hypothetical protein
MGDFVELGWCRQGHVSAASSASSGSRSGSLSLSSSAASSGRRRRLAHIELAGHDIGDEAGAVFAEEFDLAFEAGGGGIQFR